MRASYISAVFIVMLLLFSCSGNRTINSSDRPLPQMQTLSGAVAELEQMAVPKGANPAVFEQLRAALRSALIARGSEKITSTPPTGAASTVRDLALADHGDGTMDLTWSYYSVGDYNQDGKVNVADITPIAMHFGQTYAGGEQNTLPAVVDGSANKKIDVADITQIAMNFGVEVDHYAVEASATAGSGYSELATQDIGTGLDAGTQRMHFTYNFTPVAGSWYRVVPHDSADAAGVTSNEIQAPLAGAPVAPSGLLVTTLSTTKIGLSWTDNSSDELGFRIERKEGAAGTWGEIDTTLPDVEAYSDTGLTPATTYYYRIRAYNAAGNSLYSNEAFATTETAATAPNAPTGLSATAISTSEIDLAWADNSSDEDGFRIERKEGATGTWGVIATPAADVTSYPDAGLTSSTEYYYRVLAYNTIGDSAWSNEANATTLVSRIPWVHTFGGIYTESANAIAVDSGGNTFTAGTTDGYSAGGDEDTLVQKYSPGGVPLWRKTWGDTGVEQCYGICADIAGDVYVVGSSDSPISGSADAYVLKYAPDGTLLWQKTWDSTGADYASSVAVDSLGFIYVAGHTSGTGTGMYDIVLLKYSSAGELQWQKTWGGAQDDYAYAVAVDGSGNIDVTGQTASYGVSGDIILLQYSPSGTLLWQKTWGGFAGESAFGLGLDTSDNIYVAGYANSFGAGVADVCVLKYSSTGTLQWQATWGGTGGEIAYALCVDGSGNAFVVGSSNSFSAGGNEDVFLLEYSSAGGLLLQRTWGDTDAEVAIGIRVDSSGLVYVSGEAINAIGSWFTPLGTETIPAGTENSPSGTEGTPTGTVMTPTGTETTISTGFEDTGGGGWDALVMKIDPLVL